MQGPEEESRRGVSGKKTVAVLIGAVGGFLALLVAVPVVWLLFQASSLFAALSGEDEQSNWARETREVFVTGLSEDIGVLYGPDRTAISGLTRGEGQSLTTFEFETDDPSGIRPYQTYAVTLASNGEREDLLDWKPAEVMEGRAVPDFRLYRAEAPPDGGRKLEQAELILSTRDDESYRWNGRELEIDQRALPAIAGSAEQVYRLDIGGGPTYYFELGYATNETGGSPDRLHVRPSTAKAPFILVYSAHEGMEQVIGQLAGE
ncbi:hypothetical protein [Paenibacillus methanolicus]|uniref:Uncharacterized protein n=1 Tax=Paenibacillus methanolicus TaxID=582686 RepID=A0A5S5C8H1_9BACL|nr:hypothetical protein [Paenibacillus methanolicus]TYP74898.1 hypothetical protein BCM02_105445 [Paenibacillus methanolicus]